MKTTKKTKSAAEPKLTKTALADALGISRQALNVHLRSPDHPPIGDLDAWQVLLAERGRIGSAPAELRHAIAEKRLAILEETRAKLARENAIAAKELMPVADAVRHANTAGSFFMAELERLTREGPPAWAGCPVAVIATHLDRLVETIRRELAAKMATIGE